MKIRSYNDQHSTRIPGTPIVAGLKSSAQTIRPHPLKPVLLIVANREKQLSLNTAVVGYESVRTIEGTTPDSAAQEVFDRLTADMDQPVKFVEHVGPLPNGLDTERCKSYLILGPNEPRGRFSICRHKWYGWQFAHSEIFPPSVDELNRAKKWLSGSTNRDGAILILQSVIANYPNTSAETEARQLLESISEPVRSR